MDSRYNPIYHAIRDSASAAYERRIAVLQQQVDKYKERVERYEDMLRDVDSHEIKVCESCDVFFYDADTDICPRCYVYYCETCTNGYTQLARRVEPDGEFPHISCLSHRRR